MRGQLLDREAFFLLLLTGSRQQTEGGKATACRKTMTTEQLSSKPRQALVLFRMDLWTSGYPFVSFQGLLAPNFEC